mmetsp:Transcript_69265/g.223856  ORF Transcript_69265/g.223856 Transcript_69265/m.223856 type:complete len:217 (+) Transcript_69265:419-1069(+)
MACLHDALHHQELLCPGHAGQGHLGAQPRAVHGCPREASRALEESALLLRGHAPCHKEGGAVSEHVPVLDRGREGGRADRELDDAAPGLAGPVALLAPLRRLRRDAPLPKHLPGAAQSAQAAVQVSVPEHHCPGGLRAVPALPPPRQALLAGPWHCFKDPPDAARAHGIDHLARRGGGTGQRAVEAFRSHGGCTAAHSALLAAARGRPSRRAVAFG